MLFLADYMKSNVEMAAGYVSKSLQGRVQLEEQWAILAEKLNSLGGPIKTVAKWKQAWRDMKNNVKKKAAHNLNEYRGYGPGSTGNGPPRLINMSAADEDVLSVMGSVAIYEMEDEATTEPSMKNPKQNSPTHVLPGPLSPSHELPVSQSPVQTSPAPLNTFKVHVHRSAYGPSERPVGSSTAQPRKRKRIARRLDNFQSKLLAIEEEKIAIKKEKNAALNRIADALDKISNSKKYSE